MSRASWRAAVFAYAAIVACGSFAPFVWTAGGWRESLAQFLAPKPLGDVSRFDLIANVVLFVPLGFLLAAGGRRDDPPARRMLTALPVCAILGVAVEIVQTRVPGRVGTWVDVVAQSAGCVAGVAVWIARGPAVLARLRSFSMFQAPTTRAGVALRLLAAAWIVWQLAPFDFTLNPRGVLHKLRDGRIALAGAGPLNGLATGVAALPIGIHEALRRRASAGRAPAAAAGAGAIVCAVYLAKIIVWSRTVTAAALAASVAGAVAGAALAAALAPCARGPRGEPPAF